MCMSQCISSSMALMTEHMPETAGVAARYRLSLSPPCRCEFARHRDSVLCLRVGRPLLPPWEGRRAISIPGQTAAGGCFDAETSGSRPGIRHWDSRQGSRTGGQGVEETQRREARREPEEGKRGGLGRPAKMEGAPAANWRGQGLLSLGVWLDLAPLLC